MSYSTPLLIAAKRDGQELSDAAITWLLEAYDRGDVADEQMSAMLMAIFFRGLGSRELGTWTKAMINSGERL
ncbi:MAG: thymidine phosphorylase, partial [Acidobacteriota bacterium]|nr:thymidine phosphorylase [Acidobacteriota bacterium]